MKNNPLLPRLTTQIFAAALCPLAAFTELPAATIDLADYVLQDANYDVGDPVTGNLSGVWEKSNPAIRSFDLSIAEMNPGVTPAMSTPFDASNIISPTTLNPLTGLAGLHFRAATNTLLVLGEENKELVQRILHSAFHLSAVVSTKEEAIR